VATRFDSPWADGGGVRGGADAARSAWSRPSVPGLDGNHAVVLVPGGFTRLRPPVAASSPSSFFFGLILHKFSDFVYSLK
jgi:hypothetical protein